MEYSKQLHNETKELAEEESSVQFSGARMMIFLDEITRLQQVEKDLETELKETRHGFDIQRQSTIDLGKELENAYKVIADYQANMTMDDSDCGELISDLQDYDSGILNDFGGGNIIWWTDYIRAEVGRCNEFWREQIEPRLSALEEWIPIKTRLPQVGKRVNLFDEETNTYTYGVMVTYAVDRYYWLTDLGEWHFTSATHWKPLPPPPTGETK